MRVPFDLVFEKRDADIAPRMTLAIGSVTIARGVLLNPVGTLGGVRLAELAGNDLDVETSGAILTIRGLLPRRRGGDGPRPRVRRTTPLSGSGSASAA
jgi:hypothetical protein